MSDKKEPVHMVRLTATPHPKTYEREIPVHTNQDLVYLAKVLDVRMKGLHKAAGSEPRGKYKFSQDAIPYFEGLADAGKYEAREILNMLRKLAFGEYVEVEVTYYEKPAE